MKTLFFTFCVLNASILSNTFTNAQQYKCEYDTDIQSGIALSYENQSIEDIFTQLPIEAINLNCYMLQSYVSSFLGGSLPSNIGIYTNLNRIRLDDMGITGTIPPSISSVSLKRLWLNGNDMVGSIPPNFNLDISDPSTTYPQIYLQNNMFSGTIPELFKEGEHMKVFNNLFTGSSRVTLFDNLINYFATNNCFSDDIQFQEDGTTQGYGSGNYTRNSLCPTNITTSAPVVSYSPTEVPTDVPSDTPTISPTEVPTDVPIVGTLAPSLPTMNPTTTPSFEPSDIPTDEPTKTPSGIPTVNPSSVPSSLPTRVPTLTPSSIPSNLPTVTPSLPTVTSTGAPTKVPTISPTISPTEVPTDVPTDTPTISPTEGTTNAPVVSVSGSPTISQTEVPTTSPIVNTPTQLEEDFCDDTCVVNQVSNYIINPTYYASNYFNKDIQSGTSKNNFIITSSDVIDCVNYVGHLVGKNNIGDVKNINATSYQDGSACRIDFNHLIEEEYLFAAQVVFEIDSPERINIHHTTNNIIPKLDTNIALYDIISTTLEVENNDIIMYMNVTNMPTNNKTECSIQDDNNNLYIQVADKSTTDCRFYGERTEFDYNNITQFKMTFTPDNITTCGMSSVDSDMMNFTIYFDTEIDTGCVERTIPESQIENEFSIIIDSELAPIVSDPGTIQYTYFEIQNVEIEDCGDDTFFQSVKLKFDLETNSYSEAFDSVSVTSSNYVLEQTNKECSGSKCIFSYKSTTCTPMNVNGNTCSIIPTSINIQSTTTEKDMYLDSIFSNSDCPTDEPIPEEVISLSSEYDGTIEVNGGNAIKLTDEIDIDLELKNFGDSESRFTLMIEDVKITLNDGYNTDISHIYTQVDKAKLMNFADTIYYDDVHYCRKYQANECSNFYEAETSYWNDWLAINEENLFTPYFKECGGLTSGNALKKDRFYFKPDNNKLFDGFYNSSGTMIVEVQAYVRLCSVPADRRLLENEYENENELKEGIIYYKKTIPLSQIVDMIVDEKIENEKEINTIVIILVFVFSLIPTLLFVFFIRNRKEKKKENHTNNNTGKVPHENL